MSDLLHVRAAAAALAILLAGLIFTFAMSSSATASRDLRASATPTPAAKRGSAISKIREMIKGREKEPAGKVFKNLKILGDLPAEKILPIMQFGFSRSLGVNCSHCHTPGKWSSDSKPQKQIARDMFVMMGKINKDLLGKMKSLGERKAIVNCTTCHRGQIKPATSLDPPGTDEGGAEPKRDQ